MPSFSADGNTPNRVVVRVTAGKGPELAEYMACAARKTWRDYELRPWSDATRDDDDDAGKDAESVPRTPGFPAPQWIVAPPHPAGYAAQWERATAMLAARKHIYDFDFPPADQVRMCSLTGRWSAMATAPAGAWNVRENEFLSVAGHARRRFSRDTRQGFPSTWSIASAPYRAGLIERAAADPRLRGAVSELRDRAEEFLSACGKRDEEKLRRASGSPPGMPQSNDRVLSWLNRMEGAWCAPSSWDPAALHRRYELDELPDEDYCGVIRENAQALRAAAASSGVPPLTPYLAVIMQDGDHMGQHLRDFPPGRDAREWHGDVSAALAAAAGRQREVIESPGRLGTVVYAGGDDLLALTPAATALACVQAANVAFGETLDSVLGEPSASAAIVWFHAAWPLQSAVASAQRLLHDAKRTGRPGLGLAVMRRGGQRSRLVLPWADPGSGIAMISHLETLAASLSGAQPGLSGRLAASLERDRAALTTLGPVWLGRELGRRCARHGGDAAAAGALLALSYEDPSGRRTSPDAAVTVARFIAAETKPVTVPAAETSARAEAR
jgi:CRISPR-associated protein Cmr2